MRERLLDTLCVLAIIAGGLLMLYVMTGCTDAHYPPGETPPVQIVQWPGEDEDPFLIDGTNVWHELGFDATMLYLDENGEYINRVHERECPRKWYALPERPTDCQITIGVRTVDLVALGFKPSVAGVADRANRTIMLDAKHTAEDLYRVAVMAHEAGHVLLDAGHLPEGQTGVMQSHVLSWDPTQADYDLACKSIGICLDINNLK